jgi:hypothetical protein
VALIQGRIKTMAYGKGKGGKGKGGDNTKTGKYCS